MKIQAVDYPKYQFTQKTNMETLPVTLIVKAPNQQIEDQTIRCEPTWTINKLKEHLSEVYPSKPPYHEQKLIYSGQLLSDSLILKDILRHYEGQDTHTVHLVCTPKHMKLSSRSSNVKPVSTPNTTDSTQNPNITNNGDASHTVNSNNTNMSAAQNNQNQASDDQRVPHMSDMPWMNGNVVGGAYNGAPPMTPMDVNQYAMHLAWMQQAYVQYMTQYMQLAANNSHQPTAPNLTTPPGHPPHGQANQPQAQGQPPAQPAAVAGQLDLDNQERDWLDVFYMLSRALVLFSVVYFYSSPLRFVFVLFLGFTMYLYQIGFFRNINNNNNNNINGATPVGGGTEQQEAAPEEQAPTRLMVMWTFVTTFFASLIPEIPNAI